MGNLYYCSLINYFLYTYILDGVLLEFGPRLNEDRGGDGGFKRRGWDQGSIPQPCSTLFTSLRPPLKKINK